MQIDELNSFVSLFDIYGRLLSKKQFEIMYEFLNFNISETEIAEMFGASRQSVHDAISKAKKQLVEFEKNCGILKTKRANIQSLYALKKHLTYDKKAQSLIDDIIDNL